MRRDEKAKTARVLFVQNQINNKPKEKSIDEVVKDLAKDLFLSERTIWRDYAADTPEVTQKSII